MTRRTTSTAIRTSGGLLPRETLDRIRKADKSLPGTGAATYHLLPSQRTGDAANRAWNLNLQRWRTFQGALEKLDPKDRATRLTRERWLLPLFESLGFGRLQMSMAQQLAGKSFAISHTWNHSPIHLLGWRLELDRKEKGAAGAALASPHGLVQEFLNHSNAHLWGFLSNGRTLRILRDHYSLTRQAYVEFDLQAIFDGEQYSDFYLLWLLCHQSRVEAEVPEECWLEQWYRAACEGGVRALDQLRAGLEEALTVWGSGFLRHRDNIHLRAVLRSGELTVHEYYQELLRLAYRLVFVAVAEERSDEAGVPLLVAGQGQDEGAERFQRFYSVKHLRERSLKRCRTRHSDLWQGLLIVLSALEGGEARLALPALGGSLWDRGAMPALRKAHIANTDLLAGLRAISSVQEKGAVYPVDWRNLGAEELGSIYEALLALHPRLSLEDADSAFLLELAAGSRRKSTGSYYTPADLVDATVERALDPLLDRAVRAEDPERALLSLRICDPACGSGHFLIGAARRIAERLARVRLDGEEPSPSALRRALRDVMDDCIYGVDINPLAVELCKAALWMESFDAASKLPSLDAHIVVGNSLLGSPRGGAEGSRHFCWEHAFPTVFPRGGFDAVVGNPPWENVSVDHREFLSAHAPSILEDAILTSTKARLAALEELSADLFRQYQAEVAQVAEVRAFIGNAEHFPLTAKCGHNTALAFAERAFQLVTAKGRVGLLLPSNVGFDGSRVAFLQGLIRQNALAAFYDFENRRPFFADVDSRARFAMLIAERGRTSRLARLGFLLQDVSDLKDSARCLTLKPAQLHAISPHWLAMTAARGGEEAALVERVYGTHPTLMRLDADGQKPECDPNGWNARLVGGSSKEWRGKRDWQESDRDGPVFRLYEGKMFHQYDHRYAGVVMNYSNAKRPAQPLRATSTDREDPTWYPAPRSVVPQPSGGVRPWRLVFKDVSQPTNERTLLACILPASVPDGGIHRVELEGQNSAVRAALLLSGLNSFALDYLVRMKIVGNHVPRAVVAQLPMPSPKRLEDTCRRLGLEWPNWIVSRVLELTYTASELAPFAEGLGYRGDPFRWDEVRRLQIRCELDAMWCHVYDLTVPEIEKMLGTFPIVEKRDRKKYGEALTKRLIVDAFSTEPHPPLRVLKGESDGRSYGSNSGTNSECK